MYLGSRDILAAKGRFALITTVVTLITLLLVMLTGLTNGLGKQNTSALTALGPDRYVFADSGTADDGEPPEVSFTSSTIPTDVEDAWTSAVGHVVPLGVSQTRLDLDGSTEAVALMGLPEGTDVPGGTVTGDQLLIPEELGGDTPTEYFSHQPVVWADTATWQRMTGLDEPTVLMVSSSIPDDRWDEIAAATGSVAVTVTEAFDGLAAYQSERGSLLAIQGLLYGISALVTMAFLSVWTIQRTRDIAVLRALGASRRYVAGDALGQAAVILAIGVALGAGFGALLALIVDGAVPFAATTATFLLPPAGVFLLGMLGALVTMRRVSTVDPQIALGATA